MDMLIPNVIVYPTKEAKRFFFKRNKYLINHRLTQNTPSQNMKTNNFFIANYLIAMYRNRNLTTFFLLILIANRIVLATSPLVAQVPQDIPYQAVIRGNDGAALVNANVTVPFTLHQNTTTSPIEYQETQALINLYVYNSLGAISSIQKNANALVRAVRYF